MGWCAGRVARTVAVLAATGLLAGCLGTSSGGTPGAPGTSTSGTNSNGNGYGGNGGSADGSNGGVGGNGGNGYGGQGGNGYGGNGGNADGANGAAGAPGGSFSDPAGVAGSGRLTSRTIDLSHVTAVVASANFVVHLRMGGPARATVTMDDNLTDRIEAMVVAGAAGDELHLGIKPGMSVRNATLSADVTVGQLDRLAASGASRVTLAPAITSPALELIASGSSTVDGALGSGKVQATLSGASTLAVTGQVQDLRLTASGASRLPISGLTVRRLDAMLSGTSHATVTVTDSMAAQAAGASVLRYRGNPSVTRSQTSGMSSIARDSP